MKALVIDDSRAMRTILSAASAKIKKRTVLEIIE